MSRLTLSVSRDYYIIPKSRVPRTSSLPLVTQTFMAQPQAPPHPPVLEIRTPAMNVCVCWSPCGGYLTFGCLGHGVYVTDVPAHLDHIDVWTLRGNAYRYVSWSPDGGGLVSCDTTGVAWVWNWRGQEVVRKLMGTPRDWISSIGWSPRGGKIAASVGVKSHLTVWDAGTGNILGQSACSPVGLINTLSWSPTGLVVATASTDKMVRVWDSATCRQRGGPLEGHRDSVQTLSWSSTGSMLASGSKDDTVRLWDVRTGKGGVRLLRDHRGEVRSIHWSRDGLTVNSTCVYGHLYTWCIRTGKLLAHTRLLERVVVSADWSPDGRRLAMTSDDGSVRVWSTSG